MKDRYKIEQDNFVDTKYTTHKRAEQHEYGDDVDCWFGADAATLTKENIEHLQNGGFLSITVNDEYVLLLNMEGEK